jgi:hypothetical protein
MTTKTTAMMVGEAVGTVIAYLLLVSVAVLMTLILFVLIGLAFGSMFAAFRWAAGV